MKKKTLCVERDYETRWKVPEVTRHFHRLNGVYWKDDFAQMYRVWGRIFRLDGFAHLNCEENNYWAADNDIFSRDIHSEYSLLFIKNFNAFDHFERYGEFP